MTDPTPSPAPLPWYKSPLFGQAVGLALGLALAWLYAKTGISPAPITVPNDTPSVLVLNVGQPAPAQPIAVSGK